MLYYHTSLHHIYTTKGGSCIWAKTQHYTYLSIEDITFNTLWEILDGLIKLLHDLLYFGFVAKLEGIPANEIILIINKHQILITQTK